MTTTLTLAKVQTASQKDVVGVVNRAKVLAKPHEKPKNLADFNCGRLQVVRMGLHPVVHSAERL